MSTITALEPTRRDFLYVATAAVGAVGTAAATWPLVVQMNPDASTIAAAAPIDVDLKPIAEDQSSNFRGAANRSLSVIGPARRSRIARLVDLRSLPDPESDTVRV